MKPIYLLLIVSFISFNSFGQNEHLALYKLPDKTKTKKIKLNTNFTIGANFSINDSLRSWKLIGGKLITVQADSLTLQIYKKRSSEEIKSISSRTITVSTTKYNDSIPENLFTETYAIDDIDYVEISRSNETIEGIGIAGMIISGATTFIIAPLVSIDYKNGTFNSNTYRNWALAGTAGMAVSIPFVICANKTKGFKIKTKWPSPDKSLWTLRKK